MRRLITRISHWVSWRGRRGAVHSGVYDLRGAERVLAVRRAPRGEKTPLGAAHRRPQQKASEICGLIAGLVLWLMVVPGLLSALETDQYYAWGLQLADSTDAVNARFNLELERAIATFPADRPPQSCRKVVVAYRKRMRFLLLHEIQVWAWNSEWVDRIPNGGEEQREYRRTNLYSNHPLIDTGTWMPFTPTLEVAGVRMGTDKLAHLVSSGWTYYKEYYRGLQKGETPEEAKRRAVNRGIVEESLILGRLASGVTAIPDLEANSAGMQFYLDLCDTEDPILKLGEDGWFISRPVDLRDYVTPRWDESFQPPIYTKGRWRKVKPVLETYCDRLADPQVVAMRRRYRERDKESLVEKLVAERVAEGKLQDPAQFGIEAVCAEPDPSREPASEAADRIEMVELQTSRMPWAMAERRGRGGRRPPPVCTRPWRFPPHLSTGGVGIDRRHGSHRSRQKLRLHDPMRLSRLHLPSSNLVSAAAS